MHVIGFDAHTNDSFSNVFQQRESWNSEVGIDQTAECMTEESCFKSRQRQETYVFTFPPVGSDQLRCSLVPYTISWEGYFHWGKAAECEVDRSLPRRGGTVSPLLHMVSCSEQGQNKFLF